MKPRSPWVPEFRALSFGIVSLIAVFAFEGVAIATTLPVAAQDLDALDVYSLAFTIFTLTSIAGMVFAGQVINRIGLVRIVVVTMVALTLGSLIAGFAPNFWILVAGRAIQGFAIGIDLVTMYIIIGKAYPDDVRPKAFAVMAGAWVIPALMGPVVAGWMTEYSTWRSVFLVVPFVILAPVFFLIPPIKKLGALESGDSHPTKQVVLATIYALTGLSIYQFGLAQAGRNLFAIVAVTAFAGLLILSLSFKTLMPPGTIRVAPGVSALMGVRAVAAGAYFGAEAYIPLALQHERGVSVTMSGAVLAASSLTWFMGSVIQGSHKLKLSRVGVLKVGCGILATSLAMLPLAVFMPSNAHTAAIASCLVWGLGALGTGLIYPTLGVLLLSMSAEADHAKGSASIQMADSMGVVIVTALSGAILTHAERLSEVTRSTYTAIWLTCTAGAIVAMYFSSRVHAKSERSVS